MQTEKAWIFTGAKLQNIKSVKMRSREKAEKKPLNIRKWRAFLRFLPFSTRKKTTLQNPPKLPCSKGLVQKQNKPDGICRQACVW